MADIIQQIDEFPTGTLELASILHSKNNAGIDIIGTVQDIIDLVPGDDLDTHTYEVGPTITPGSDYVLYTDASDSGRVKRSSFEDFKTALNLVSVSGSVTSGYYNIGDLQFRFGTGTSLNDAAQVFSYSVPFSTETLAVITNGAGINATNPILATAKTATGFTVDRNSNVDGAILFYYLAVGR